jgi:hypothetical protein
MDRLAGFVFKLLTARDTGQRGIGLRQVTIEELMTIFPMGADVEGWVRSDRKAVRTGKSIQRALNATQ